MKIYSLIIILIVLTACTCEEQTEPKLIIDFHDSSIHHYSYCYGIGGNDSIHDYNELPIDINSDTSIYVLKYSTITDTIAITYKRNIFYESEACGFAIELESLKLLNISTFDSASFDIYNYTYTYPVKSNKNAYSIHIYR